MLTAIILVSFVASRVAAQNGRGPLNQEQNGHGWDIRLAVPGEPGNDYPTLGSIPRTTFSCAGKDPGYYADVETGCQAFRVCTVGSTYGFQSFLCPNGTLFNQEVFVCDWWMSVKCQNTQRIIDAKKEKFSNLRLGPQLMKDIKKMLTHTMRNPYDKAGMKMKSNLVVMQDYKPPPGQLFPNGALIAGPERSPNKVYVQAKQNLVQRNNLNDIIFSASTPETRYVPAAFTNQLPNADAEVFQRQRQNVQYEQQNLLRSPQSQTRKHVQNGHKGQFTQKNTDLPINFQSPRVQHNFNISNSQYIQTQRANLNAVPTQTLNNHQQGQINLQYIQNTNRKKNQSSIGKLDEIVSYTKQQFNQNKQLYTYRPPLPLLPGEVNRNNGNELDQNLVSDDIPSTVITKTLTYSKLLQAPKSGRPKSRVTVKTWIVKPKTARLLAEPSSYTYARPTQTPTENLILEETSPYFYDRPTSPSQLERVVNENSPTSYVYNKPTIPTQLQRVMNEDPKPYVYERPPSTQSELIETDEEDAKPYVYERPTIASKQVITTRSEPSRSYLPPSPTQSTRVTQSARLNLTPPTSLPTQASRVYLAPSTFKPASRLYLLPEKEDSPISRQYLDPNSVTSRDQSAQLRALPTTASPKFTFSNVNSRHNPSYSVTKESRLNASRNNLTFTDILTKEKLDITVNDIVRDTGRILQTASPPPQFRQYRQDDKSVDYPEENYLPPDESGENLTSDAPVSTSPSKSARIVQPSRNLEPPGESFTTNTNTNQLSNLPFYKESSIPNTIERTVSLKITIPERVASYLFRGSNETDFDRLEILNTGSSNYLVLSNNVLNQNKGNSIPVGENIHDKIQNLSNSQALVFSFLADSINAAKEYSNIVKQDALSVTSRQPPRFENLNNEDLSQIANKVSQLTSSQYSKNSNLNTLDNASTIQTNSLRSNRLTENTKQPRQQNQAKQTQSAKNKVSPSLQSYGPFYSSQFETDNIQNTNLLNIDNNQIYSGQLYQLPVPEVTNQIYNRPQSTTLVQESRYKQNAQTENLPRIIDQHNNEANHNNLAKQSSAEVEIVQSPLSPLNSAKLQSEPSKNPESFYSQGSLNTLLNSDNGISAQLQDKIVGTIPHPLEDNKLVTYEKDQSYYLYTNFDKDNQNIPLNAVNKFNDIPSVITFQFVPSVSYQLEDEKDQQTLLNTFQIDEFGVPKSAMRSNLVQNTNGQRAIVTSNVDYTVEHPTSARQVNVNKVNALYKGPSSYSAPQGSIGNLYRHATSPNYSSKLEELNSDNSEGYPKTTPVRRFIF